MPRLLRLATIAIALVPPTIATAQEAPAFEPITIIDQGSFAAGGTVLDSEGTFDSTDPRSGGQTFHGDHLYAFYQIPQDPRPLPLVMWHGAFQSARTWETTADGREGFQTLFLRRGFPVYLVDQPRRGRAGNSTVATEIAPTPRDQFWFDMFRIGQWPQYFDGVSFERSEETRNQYFRAITPNTGPYDAEVIAASVSALFDRIGEGVLVTHSQSGGPGWLVAMRNERVRGIVSYEPGSGFVFPEGEVPDPMPSAGGTLEADAVPADDFAKLTRIPIVIYYGDNIPAEPTDAFGVDNWRVRLDMARLWADAVNRHGGDATVVHLPEVGIDGNTHFPFSDLNNLAIADLAADWLADKGLD